MGWMTIFILWMIVMFPVHGFSQEKDTKRATVAKTRELLTAIGFPAHSIIVQKDSVRFVGQKGTYYDLIFEECKLWNLRKYDQQGNALNHGNFRNGDGMIYLKGPQFIYTAEVQNGLLSGSTQRFTKFGFSDYRLTNSCEYKDGLKDGEYQRRSAFNQSVIAEKRFYLKGELIKVQSFGIRKFKLALNWSLFKPVITEPEKLCQESIYENGKIVSSECFVKKCKSCGY